MPGETARPTGAIWKYIPQNGKLFSGIKVGEANPKMEVMARGLRNSIAMLVHPKYPEPGYAFLQGENSRDFQDPAQPAEEINSIVPGKHYGWPYCFNNSEVSPEYADFLARDPNYRNLCKGGGVVQYQAPHTLLPPHSSPLDMKYYTSNRFPELRGKLLVTLHGWSATGARFGFLNVDAYGFPVKNSSALSYNQNCKEKTYITTAVGEPVGGSQFEELTAGWHSVGGKRPHGRPVGMAVANDGAIWVIDDINKAILRVDASMDQPEPLPCDIRTEAEIAEIIGFIEADPAKRSELTLIRKTLVEKHCTGCHSDFDLRSGMNEQERDRSVAHYLLAQPGWVIPPYAQKSTVHIRTRGKGFGRQMPGNARELLAKDDEFAATINTLDHWIRTIVPGQIHEVRLAKETHMRIRDQAGTVCGRVPNKEVVLVVDNAPKEKPGFMRIYKPAGEFLDGDCLQGSKYYMGKDYLFPTTIERNPASAPESLFMSQPVTAKGEFGPGIEGPATSKDGRLFVPSFQGKKNSIGVVDKNGKVSKFIDLPKEAKINALRIDSAGSMFAADYSEHKIYKIDLSTKVAVVHAFDKSMNQPNDIALDSSGAIYATDPNWKKKSGRVWRVSKDGSLKVVASELGAVNGIDLSHDGKTLYVGDSTRTEVHAFDIIGETLTNKRTLIKFKDGEIDGIKVDSKGNLYVARITLGVIAKVSADGKIIREIPVNGAEPTNLTFGGADGRTIFVTQRKGGFIESFRVDDPGREF